MNEILYNPDTILYFRGDINSCNGNYGTNMKPEYELIPEKPENSFLAKTVVRDSRPLLAQAWHYHPEIEICFTRTSQGKRFVGNQIADYQERDLVMFGSNLPHGFTTDFHSEQDVIQFSQGFLGDVFWTKPEALKLKTLINQSKAGLFFYGKTRDEAERIIKEIHLATELEKIIHLLRLLDLLSTSEESKTICEQEATLNFDQPNLNRVQIIYDHIMSNYQGDVNIKEVADKLNLSEVAFFKFMKKHTKKNYTQLINEFRVNHACKLLINTQQPILQVCYDSGFNNISYFNRKFKQIMMKTPVQFRVQYLGK